MFDAYPLCSNTKSSHLYHRQQTDAYERLLLNIISLVKREQLETEKYETSIIHLLKPFFDVFPEKSVMLKASVNIIADKLRTAKYTLNSSYLLIE
ncbi:hypothetical protein C9J48_10450 [Photobacterium profundum]|uniref:Uncharacterized protein n=2 Tax=Photobacterium profundum TaxID=74109 RepID=Q1YX39_9GAMM|nr:hypothetical protein P3TCK_09238 [Photobacterium profundum 3TCK]PSV62380.1 hypothetical protein C9J48_10450 [Photobacterium profundum]